MWFVDEDENGFKNKTEMVLGYSSAFTGICIGFYIAGNFFGKIIMSITELTELHSFYSGLAVTIVLLISNLFVPETNSPTRKLELIEKNRG